MKRLILATLLALPISSIMAAPSPIIHEDVFCPPASAISCDGKGNCTLSPEYKAYWSIAVAGQPKSPLSFGSATIQNPPGNIPCTYGSSWNNYAELISKQSLRPDQYPDNGAKHSSWKQMIGNVWICKAFGNPHACPVKFN